MSRLTPGILPLDKGLNLQTAKILAPEGTVLDSLNYDQVDFQGQKRIDGFARYDGSCLPAIDDFVLIDPANVTSDGSTDLAYTLDDVLFGVDLGVFDADYNAYAVLNENALPEYIPGKEYVEDSAAHYDYVLQYNAQLRVRIEQLPGAVAGLHWFRDRLYAVADMMILELDAVYDVKANDTFTSSSGQGIILDHVDSETATFILVEAYTDSDGTITLDRLATDAEVVAQNAGYKASFFESRTEQQVVDEDADPSVYDFGWRFKHLGWAVPFEQGTTLFGGLTSLNQNRQGVGTEGPTSTAGNNGKPLVLTQKVNITNGPTQVNGWKTSTSPSTFNLEVAALDEVDSHYIYADAYISWDGATGTVSAPGITGAGLIEYPANNTVVVDV